MSAIYKALATAQKHFEAARKESVNGGFKSKYADLSSCMDAVREPLNDQGVFVTQTLETVESGILVETVFLHESGETYSNGKLFIPVVKHDAQGYGSAITYGRRYSLLTACGVAPEEDDGNAASKAAPEKKTFDVVGVLAKVEACTTEEQLTELWKTESVNAQLAGSTAYNGLKKACKDRKTTIGVAA